MSRSVKALVVLALSASGVFVTSSVADARGNTTVMNLRGDLVNADFTETDGCLETDVFVTANSGVEQDLPNTTHYAIAAVDIFQYNSCTATTVLDATGQVDSLPAGAFQVSNQLDQASLNAVLPASDLVSGSTFDITVNVQWTGTSDITRSHSNTNEVYPGCHIINRWKGSGRDANASGTVAGGGTDLTLASSQFGEIGYVIDGSEIMGCS
jgi:hypothetical protein